jgi:hypothetical protein
MVLNMYMCKQFHYETIYLYIMHDINKNVYIFCNKQLYDHVMWWSTSKNFGLWLKR